MTAGQKLLFPDPQPLVERLGREFFLGLPESPGVYLMRDAADVVLYVGKANNLRKRLASYRVANPDRMPRRQLRMLRSVVRIELESCSDEAAALARESELLLALRPKFNRAGVWRPPPRYFAWRMVEQRLCLSIAETAADPGWRLHGPLGSGAVALRAVLARLLWAAVHPASGFAALPVGWSHGRLETEAAIHCGVMIDLVAAKLESVLLGQSAEFGDWIRACLPGHLHPFEKALVEADLEFIADASARWLDRRDSANVSV